MSELRVKLEGETANLGEVAAGDVARLILAVETAIARAATVVMGAPKAKTGRFIEPVTRASRLRLVRIDEGSVVPVLEVPGVDENDDSLSLKDVALGEAAVDRLLDTLDPAAPQTLMHPVLLRAMMEIAVAGHIGERYDAITLESSARGMTRAARIDTDTIKVLEQRAAEFPPTVHPESVAGVLVEADFEKHTGRVRTPSRPAVVVSFDETMSDEIQEALRESARFVGDVTIDERTSVVQSIALRGLERREQLQMDFEPATFWADVTIDELARAQGISGNVDLERLYDADASDEEQDAFIAALTESAE